jgi:transglutaminase-like putative cysteine protease
VTLDPHTIRLRPRSDGTQRVIEYAMQIDPAPAGRSECLDAEGNSVVQAWFSAPQEYLHVTTQFSVETLRDNPFDFLLPPPSQLLFTSNEAASPEVLEFARQTARHAGDQTMTFLELLARQLCLDYRQVVREEGAPLAPEKVLHVSEASCRDLAVLYCAACRAMNLTARFVSGYEIASARADHPYMHAWAEVFLPGGGWRGYDPARGMAVGADHVAVAASTDPAMATPVSGSYRGAAVSSIDVTIQMLVS